jgi:hypothetical protein
MIASSLARLLSVDPFTDAMPSAGFHEIKTATTVGVYSAASGTGSDSGRSLHKPSPHMSGYFPPLSRPAITISPSLHSEAYDPEPSDLTAGSGNGAGFQSRMQRLQDLVLVLNRKIAEDGKESSQVAELRGRIMELIRDDAARREVEERQSSVLTALPPPYEPRLGSPS